MAGVLGEARLGQISRGELLQGADNIVTGYFEVLGSGAFTYRIGFPIKFVNEPVVVFGFAGTGATETTQITAIVKDWSVEQRADGLANYVVGGTVHVSVAGSIAQRIRVMWMATGVALRRPV